MARGEFSNSDSDSSLGEREAHGDVAGVWVTDRLEDVSKHYAWATNTFGNKVFYGLFFKVDCCREHLQKVFRKNREWVFDKEGIFITHACVAYNRSLAKGDARLQFFSPDASLRVSKQNAARPSRLPFRVYPAIRKSVWHDFDADAQEQDLFPRGYPTAPNMEYPDAAAFKAARVQADPPCQPKHTKAPVTPWVEGNFAETSESEGDSDLEEVEKDIELEQPDAELRDADVPPWSFPKTSASSSNANALANVLRRDADTLAAASSEVKKLGAEVRQFETRWLEHVSTPRAKEFMHALQAKEIEYALASSAYSVSAKRAFVREEMRKRSRVRLHLLKRMEDLPGVYQPGRIKNKKRKSQCTWRYDWASGKIFLWSEFLKFYGSIPRQQLQAKWMKMLRAKDIPKERNWHGQPTSLDWCLDYFEDEYSEDNIHAWFKQLPRL